MSAARMLKFRTIAPPEATSAHSGALTIRNSISLSRGASLAQGDLCWRAAVALDAAVHTAGSLCRHQLFSRVQFALSAESRRIPGQERERVACNLNSWALSLE
jgi:hypothetical protein